MTWVWWASNSVNIIVNAVGIVANFILLYMVLKKTPRNLISYSVLIFNTALFDLLACIGAVFILMRQGFVLTCHYHGIHSILVSVAYRYYVLGRFPPRIYNVIVTILVVYLPTFFVFIVYAISGDDEAQVKADIEKNFGYDVNSECVSGRLKKTWEMTLTAYYMMLPPLPIYVAILILRRLVISKITLHTTMSERTRQLHKQLLRALAIQACLPVLYLGGIAVNIVRLLNIYDHPIMEYSFVYLFVPIPAMNPLVSLYLVGPYRVWLRDYFSKPKQPTARGTVVSTVTAWQQRGTAASMHSQSLHS